MRARQVGLVAALAFHAALFVLLSHNPRAPRQVSPKLDRPALQVRLIAGVPPRRQATAEPAAAPPARANLPIRVPKRMAIETAAVPNIPSVAEPAASTPFAEGPLKLEHVTRAGPVASQPSVRDQVMRDPRANSPRPTPGERMAEALGSDERLVEESKGNGRMIVKKGRDCYDVRVARNAELDPFTQSTRPTGKLVTSCR